MRRTFLPFVFLFLLTVLLVSRLGQGFPSFLSFSNVQAQEATPSASDLYDDYLKKQQEIEDLEKKITDLTKQAKTLANQISYFDSQIRLTTLQIQEKERTLQRLQQEITDLSYRIVSLEESLEALSGVLIEKVQQTYKNHRVNPMLLLLSSKSFSDFSSRVKYLEVAQTHALEVMYQMQDAKDAYELQQQVLKEKEDEEKTVKLQLEVAKKSLDQQKNAKQVLLTRTKNDEFEYQRLLDQALSEQKAIESVISQTAKLSNGVQVNSGDIIAFMGNSGYPYCSSGAHLHFEVRSGGAHVNPGGYLKNISTSYADDQVGRISPSGSWDWPMLPPIRLTQEYGSTFWTRLPYWPYRFHTGYDMVGEGSDAIRAVAGGMKYRASTTCGKAALNYVAIDHGNGLWTYYFHVR